MNNQTTQNTVGNVFSEETREVAIKELGLEGAPVETQDQIIATVGETLIEYINVAFLKALGVDGVTQLNKVPEADQEAFAAKLLELLPNSGDIVRDAVKEGLANYKDSLNKALNGV